MSAQYHAKVMELIHQGIIVCPVTQKKLKVVGEFLKSQYEEYALQDHVPVLIAKKSNIKTYSKSSNRMNMEYKKAMQLAKNSWLNQIRSYDYRTRSSKEAEHALFQNTDNKSICLSIGGGPQRQHPQLLNLNIGNFPNVDIVGDAHLLPFKSNTVDRIYSNAVFEHLHSPDVACQEMWRVLKKGGRAYVTTPFLQAYHGYPNHYQNFTLTGHDLLFKKQGFRVISSGPSVGPTMALRFMIAKYLLHFFPKPLNLVLRALWEPISLIIGPLDLLVRNHPNAHFLASTNYTLIEKI